MEIVIILILLLFMFAKTDCVLRLPTKNKAQDMQDLFLREEILKNNHWACRQVQYIPIYYWLADYPCVDLNFLLFFSLQNKLAFGRTSPLALQFLVQLKLITSIDNESEVLKLESSYEKSPSSDIGQKIDLK